MLHRHIPEVDDLVGNVYSLLGARARAPNPPRGRRVITLFRFNGCRKFKDEPLEKKNSNTLYCSVEARLAVAALRRTACRGRCSAAEAFLPAASRLFLSEREWLPLHTH